MGERMVPVFLTHSSEMLAMYYGERALAALREMTEVRLNPTGGVLDGDTLIEHARGCPIIVSDRQTAAPAAFFDAASYTVAFLRCAVDIRNIDVQAASRNGVLVTRATPGFMASVAEMTIGTMIDLARGISRSVGEYRSGVEAEARMGRQLKGSTVGLIGYGAISEALAPICLALGMKVLVTDPHKRVDAPGLTPIPRKILHTLRVTYAGEEVFRMTLSPGIAANPYLEFTTVATETGDLVFEWEEDGGAIYRREARLVVT